MLANVNKMDNYKKQLFNKADFSECVSCKKPSPKKELKENSKFAGYGNKEICNKCTNKIDL